MCTGLAEIPGHAENVAFLADRFASCDPERVSDRIDESTWTTLEAFEQPVVLAVPVGSCEQHGPHLPLSTDTLVAEALATTLAARHPGVVLAPSIAITASGEHQGFPGTLSIGNDVMESLVVELVRSADWTWGVVLVNGHGGNRQAVDRAVTQLRAEGRRVLAWWPVVPGADPHAGHTETSIMLALHPHLVRLDRAAPGPTPSLALLIEHGVKALSQTGVLGDPTGATAEHGRAVIAELEADLLQAVHHWDVR
jgi:mycofactocin precursor peptide peptidase